MPLSMRIASLTKGLILNLTVFGERDWGREVRTRLIDESIGLLNELLLDPFFNLTLQGAYESCRGADNKEIQVLRSDSSLLAEFLRKEAFLLRAAGFDEQSANEVVAEVERTVSAGLLGEAKPEEVFSAMVRLKFSLEEVRDRDQVRRWAKAARSLAISFGGAALIGLNLSGFAVTLGITGPLTAASGTGGAFILKEGAKGIVDLLKEP